MAFATANSPANRKPGDNAQTATPPQAQAQQRQSPGKADPPYARQSPQHAPEPQRTRTPSAPESPTRRDENRAPERQPSRPSDFGVLIELSTKFPWHYPSRVPNSQSISRAEQRVPAAKNRQLCPAAVKIDDSSQPQGQNARLFALSGSSCAHNRQKRPFPTSETAKNRLF